MLNKIMNSEGNWRRPALLELDTLGEIEDIMLYLNMMLSGNDETSFSI